jgi:UDP-N-acetylglucosamine diphosphorylase / glucose-1-phosphate thymidylyltransferase / UDP-N-acetylgalactosamine diphosphorylase / glucosamine-1-phosphate N-acetyltransferase / galactosamine-1-phosphate N-acetyltransferase
MNDLRILLFEDGNVDRLFPITIGRPAFAIRCAGHRLIDWIERMGAPIAAVVRRHLRGVQEMQYPQLKPSLPAGPTPLLLINARLVPCRTNLQALAALVADRRFGAIRSDGELAAAFLPRTPEVAAPAGNERFDPIIAFRDELEHSSPLATPLKLFEYPHDVIRYNLDCIGDNLEDLISRPGLTEVRDGVFVAEGAVLGDYGTTDTSKGPIVIDRGATIGPYCFLRGPVYIGPNSRVIEHSAIKDAVCVGHTVKLGGEVEASVIEPFTNKQHHGFLGHSYLGSWINWGAGTSNSDLKNTYGEVKMEYRGRKVSTGMQFVGCIIGDYSKTAINTGVFTGKTVGVCSMLYGFVTTNVPSYVNYARSFGQVTEMAPEVMVSTQQRMFARRQQQPTRADVQLMYDMFELTRHERQLAGEPLSL